MYPLPNGYEYTNYDGMHVIDKEDHSSSLYLGNFLNRVYVGNRYFDTSN